MAVRESQDAIFRHINMSSKKIFSLGQKPFTAYLAFLSAFVPLSTDLYLPALPCMTEQLQATPELVNLTLSSFMLVYALTMLVWGPLSDKYGRRPILLLGLAIYVLASAGCAISQGIAHLVAGRCLQALGSGAIGAVTMAIVKDTFRGRTMENVLTAIQTMTLLAPMLAPVLGGALLAVTSWRGIFWLLTACGAVGLAGWLVLGETLRSPTRGSALHTLTRLAYVLRNPGFRYLLTVFSVSCMPFMAYLAVSSYVYQTIFGLSPQAYSAFFSVNALFSIAGPLLYVRVFREYPKRYIMAASFGVTAVAGLLLLTSGHGGPFAFAGLYLLISFAHSGIRPPSTVLMMSQLDGDNGSVASLMGACALLCGSLAMLLCSLPWPDFIVAAGVISLVVGVLCTAAWLFIDGRGLYRGARS